MDVIMLGWEFPPFVSGGLGTHCYHLTEALSKEGHAISFIMPDCPDHIYSACANVIKATKNKIIRVGVSLMPYLPSVPISVKKHGKAIMSKQYGDGFYKDVMRYTDAAADAAKGLSCDVIHCHDWMTFLAGVRIKEETGKPLVVTVHSTEHDRSGSLYPNPWISDIEWQGMYAADKVITVSHYMKEQIHDKYGVPRDKIDVVYNSLNPEQYSNKKVRFGTREKVVLFLGRMTLQKGPDYLLKAAAKVLKYDKDVRFIFVGTGDMLPQLIDESIDLGIADKVTFTGYQDSIEQYYQMADLYVMPSVSEPFGITTLEAMASGAPVLISKTSGVAEVVTHKMSVDFWDHDRMASSIIGALRYPCMRQEMSRNGYEEVCQMSWDDVAKKTGEVYQNVLIPLNQ